VPILESITAMSGRFGDAFRLLSTRLVESPQMMSVSPGMGAGQAGRYFSREDYYLREAELGDNSRWLGQGTEALGLQGPVGEAEFRALCRGEDPAGDPGGRDPGGRT
jgi:hypothetical protein